MHPDFIQLKTIEGELKLSRKTYEYGLTVSTKEFVYHKPHVNYHIKLANIVSIVPFEGTMSRPVSIENSRPGAVEYIHAFPVSTRQFRVFVSSAEMHNRSGRFPTGAMEFVLPIDQGMMKIIGEYSGMSGF